MRGSNRRVVVTGSHTGTTHRERQRSDEQQERGNEWGSSQQRTGRYSTSFSFLAAAFGVLVLGGLVFLFVFTGASVLTPLGILLLILVGVPVWLAPILVARARKAPNQGAIVVVTLLLGWSLVGWAVALAMAFADRRTSQPA